MTASPVEPPPEAFNFAAHLLQANAGRPAKAAFIDDAGIVTYGELDERARRFAAALKERGVKREERALILMQDGADWPVAFLGAMLAGIVPVAVNTLLTADDLAYMLEHSRAQAVLVSGAIKPALKAALAKADHEAHTVVVSRPTQPLEPERNRVRGFLCAARRRSRSLRARGPMIPRSGSIRRGRRAGRKGRCIRTPIRIGRPSSTARRSWASPRATSASPPRSSSSPMDSETRSPSRSRSARQRCSWPSVRRQRPSSSAGWAGSAASNPPFFTAHRPVSPACSLRTCCRNARM